MCNIIYSLYKIKIKNYKVTKINLQDMGKIL